MERHLQFTASMKKQVAIMRLDKRIGPELRDDGSIDDSIPYINPSSFADEMMWHHNNGRHVQIRINSIGGNVLQGWDIYDTMQVCEASTHNYGVAASMAGIIFLGGKEGMRTADAHATLMLHGPHNAKDGTPAKGQFADMIRNQFVALCKSRTHLTDDKVAAIMNGGDHYFDASDMLAAGICDKIIDSEIAPPAKANASARKLYEIYATLENQNENNMDLTKLFAGLFGGNTESEQIAAAMKAKTDLVAAQQKETALQAEITALKAEAAALKVKVNQSTVDAVVAKATALVEAAITSKKITPTDKEKAELIQAATANYTTIETLFGKMGVQSKVVQKIAAAGSIVKEGKESMSYEKMAKEDPEGLLKIAEEQPELFNAMADEMNLRLTGMATKRDDQYK